MRRFIAIAMLAGLGLAGCSPQFWGGAAVGALATGAGYEINAAREMDRARDAYHDERISRREYEIRRRQIERGSILY
jgi:hypothetical protein